jgi:OOP family OmpA-OmpF porin
MKTMLRIAAAAPLLAAPFANANSMPDQYFYVGGQIAHTFYYDNKVAKPQDGLDNVNFFGGQVGWRFHPNWSAQVTYQNVENDAESKYDTGLRLDVTNIYASLRYHFNNVSILGFEPYAGLNLGNQNFEVLTASANIGPEGEDADDFTSGIEFGVQRMFADLVVLDLGSRTAYNDDTYHFESSIYAGINLAFGVRRDEVKEEVYVAPEPDPSMIDSDGDGVPDYRDRCPNTPAGAVVDEDGCQVYETLDQRETSVIYFGFDRADIQEQFTGELAQVAELLKAGEEGTVVLEGHTDSTGPAEYNMGLSERRAAAVKKLLTETYGISADHIEVRAFGETQPIADNDTEEGRAKNRRVDISVETSVTEAQFK